MRPKAYIRPDDYEPFTINDNGTYSPEFMKRDFPEALKMEYSENTMIANGFIPVPADS